MQQALKGIAHLLLLAGCVWFGYSTYRDYTLLMMDAVEEGQPESRAQAEIETKMQKAVKHNADATAGALDLDKLLEEEESFRGTRANKKVSKHYLRLIGNGIGFAAFMTGFGFLLAHDGGDLLRFRLGREIDYLDDRSRRQARYEKADYLANKGKTKPAMVLLREILAEDSGNWLAQVRLAEIYDKNLEDYATAAEEYRAALALEMHPEKWGWTAIRLCNIYTGQIDEPQRAMILLRRLANEYPDTKAGQKAITRLAMVQTKKLAGG